MKIYWVEIFAVSGAVERRETDAESFNEDKGERIYGYESVGKPGKGSRDTKMWLIYAPGHFDPVSQGMIEKRYFKKKQELEKIRYNEKIASGEMKLKYMKNEINKARVEHSRDVVDFAGQQKTLSSMTESNSSRNVIDRVVDIVEQVASHLRVLQAQVPKYTSVSNEDWKGQGFKLIQVS